MQRQRDFRLCLSTDTDTSPLLPIGHAGAATAGPAVRAGSNAVMYTVRLLVVKIASVNLTLRVHVSLNAVLSYLRVSQYCRTLNLTIQFTQ